MAVITQPNMQSDDGAILTVGMLCNNDRYEIVMPMGNSAPVSRETDLLGLINIFEGVGMPLLLGCMCSAAQVIFQQAESMVHGKYIPYRKDYALGTNPGTLDADPLPTANAACGLYYIDPTQTLTTGRLRVAKQFIAGIANTQALGDIIEASLGSAVQAFIDQMANGMTGDDGTHWWRVGKAVRETAQALPLIVVTEIRNYIVTQRRRMVPRN